MKFIEFRITGISQNTRVHYSLLQHRSGTQFLVQKVLLLRGVRIGAVNFFSQINIILFNYLFCREKVQELSLESIPNIGISQTDPL